MLFRSLSLKVSNKKDAQVPISNPGLGTLRNYTGVDSSEDYKQKANKLFGEHNVVGQSQAQREESMKNRSDEEYDKIRKKGGDILKDIASKQSEGLQKASPTQYSACLA